jgi:hypothetical protein
MTFLAKIRIVSDGIYRSLRQKPPPGEPVNVNPAPDGHAPGHRHLEPPPKQATPKTPDTKPPTDQPYVRTTHSDSQTRRFRR